MIKLLIASQHKVQFIVGGFLVGNEGFIRATPFTDLVAWFLKQGQPGICFNFEHCYFYYE